MSQRKHVFIPGEFYHIYNRGVDKRRIYAAPEDNDRFQVLLYVLNTDQRVNVRDLLNDVSNPYEVERGNRLVSIGAYCLMPNHFHLLASPVVENGLSIFMQKLTTSYTMYFNAKNDRTGSLFQGKFKSQLADNDQYLKYLFSYIHLNPIKLYQHDWRENGIVDKEGAGSYLSSYKYSSYPDHLNQERIESNILDRQAFPNYFQTVVEAEQEVRSWLSP